MKLLEFKRSVEDNLNMVKKTRQDLDLFLSMNGAIVNLKNPTFKSYDEERSLMGDLSNMISVYSHIMNSYTTLPTSENTHNILIELSQFIDKKRISIYDNNMKLQLIQSSINVENVKTNPSESIDFVTIYSRSLNSIEISLRNLLSNIDSILDNRVNKDTEDKILSDIRQSVATSNMTEQDAVTYLNECKVQVPRLLKEFNNIIYEGPYYNFDTLIKAVCSIIN